MIVISYGWKFSVALAKSRKNFSDVGVHLPINAEPQSQRFIQNPFVDDGPLVLLKTSKKTIVHVRELRIRSGTERFFGECNNIDLIHAKTGPTKTKINRIERTVSVMFDPAEAFLFRGGNENAVTHDCRRCVMSVLVAPIIESENIH